MRHILLLCGINVGGKNKVEIRELNALLTAARFEEVGSYINNGNLFFSSVEVRKSCVSKIRALLEAKYDFPIPFVLLTREKCLEGRDALSQWWHEEMARKDVLFYACGMNTDRIRSFTKKAALYNEVVHPGRHAVFWGEYDEAEYLRTVYHEKLVRQALYREVTIRDGNAYEKIAAILEDKT